MKSIGKLAVLALGIAMFSPAIAQAKTNVNGGPYTNLKPIDQVIHLALSGYPTTSGLYILQCVKSPDSSRPKLCNQAAQLWISTTQGASFAPNADIQFKPTAKFTSGVTDIDCLKDTCGIFIRLDHTAPTDTSEDQFIPITFIGGVEEKAVVPADVITASVNGVALSASAPFEVRYRDVFKVEAMTKSGVAPTYASLAPACSINGNEVTVLKGTGFCDIAVSSPGNTQFSMVTAHFPLKLGIGVQNIAITTSAKSGTKINLPESTNFGEKITYSVAKSANCSIRGRVLSLTKKGACALKASAPGLANTYGELKANLAIKIG